MTHVKQAAFKLALFIIFLTTFYPAKALADCCVCTHPNVTGKFCISYPAGFDCSTLKNNSDTNIQASACTNATACAQASSGGSNAVCVNTPTESGTFNFSSLPQKSGTAVKGTATPAQGLPFNLNIPIPGLTLSPSYEQNGIIYVPYLAQYIVGLQKMMIGIGIVVAAMMLVYGGITYIISGTGAKIRDSKEIIQDALIGMALILGSYVILANINPNTTVLAPLMVPKIQKETFDFNTGYDPNNTDSANDVICGEECPTMQHPEGKGSATRMKAACKGGGTKEALKAVLQTWVKEAAPYGSGYIRGGSGYGKEMKVASPYTGYLFCHLAEKGWLSAETKTACDLPEGFTFDVNRVRGHCSNGENVNLNNADVKNAPALVAAQKSLNKGPCYSALKKDYITYFVCPMKCNDLFGADCSGFVGLALGCAGVKHNVANIYKVQAQAVAESGNTANPIVATTSVNSCKTKSKTLSINDPACNPANPEHDDNLCKCTPIQGYAAIALTKESFISSIIPSLPFGSTIEIKCKGAPIPHMFMYTGKMGLPFELVESGGPRTPSGGSATFLNWKGQSEFTVGGGINTTPSLAGYLNGMCSGGVQYIYAVGDL
ncbi:MAG: pilin [Patescibacteria group bacterium]|nr:pilin [Patescibacteria group bacterium]